MGDLQQVLKVGDLLIIERGEYSDSCWAGPVKMLVTATKQELADAFQKQWRKGPHGKYEDKPLPENFLPWLIKTKRAEHVDCISWHVGSYGEFEP